MATPQVPEFWPMALGASADTVEIPDTTPAGEGIPSFTSLFPILTQIDPTAGGVFIQRTWMNGLFQLLGNNLWYLQHGCLFPWNENFDYPAGAHVLGSDNSEYIAVQENTGQDPTTDSEHTFWKIFTIPSDYIGATASAPGTAGLVPPAEAGQQEYYLGGDGNWRALTSGMPVGSIYIQFTGQTAPSDLFGGTWSNVSSSYAGLFFRAEGGAAAAFGGSQSDGAPNVAGWFSLGVNQYTQFAIDNVVFQNIGSISAAASDLGLDARKIQMSLARGNNKFGAAAEVRPVNSTIRIWKRTA